MMKRDNFDLIKELNEMSKQAGSIYFKINYTATEGNLKVHEDFAKFCYDEANHNYLTGIAKLLEYRKTNEELNKLKEQIDDISFNLEGLKNMFLEWENTNEKRSKTSEEGRTKTKSGTEKPNLF